VFGWSSVTSLLLPLFLFYDGFLICFCFICFLDLALEKTDGKPVLVIGATNRPDALDPALRFDENLSILTLKIPVRFINVLLFV
jgi:hypothetical protein